MRTGSALSGAMSDSPEDHMDWELLEVEDVIATIKEDLGHTKDVAEEVALVESQSGVQASRTKLSKRVIFDDKLEEDKSAIMAHMASLLDLDAIVDDIAAQAAAETIVAKKDIRSAATAGLSYVGWAGTVGSRKAGIYKILCWSPGAPNRKLPDTILCRGLATTRKVIDKGLDHSLQTKMRLDRPNMGDLPRVQPSRHAMAKHILKNKSPTPLQVTNLTEIVTMSMTFQHSRLYDFSSPRICFHEGGFAQKALRDYFKNKPQDEAAHISVCEFKYFIPTPLSNPSTFPQTKSALPYSWSPTAVKSDSFTSAPVTGRWPTILPHNVGRFHMGVAMDFAANFCTTLAGGTVPANNIALYSLDNLPTADGIVHAVGGWAWTSMMQVYRAGGVLASIGPGHMERRWLEWIESMEVDWKAIPHHNPDDSRPWMSRVWSAIQVVMKSRAEPGAHSAAAHLSWVTRRADHEGLDRMKKRISESNQVPERKAQISALGKKHGAAGLEANRARVKQGLLPASALGHRFAGVISRLKGIQLLHLHLYTDGRAMVQVLASNMPRSTPQASTPIVTAKSAMRELPTASRPQSLIRVNRFLVPREPLNCGNAMMMCFASASLRVIRAIA
ncbi:hypothetical protein EHS25_000538 [Saitozyma podzolica]|uniref:Uncharacterized protein n=1 Tax=Saitozyma podzolica TaxID=1890683 RepID=A0A427YWM4_9TREE|nr:hypothetical protein EHS25_000538 [Saitozyma podzolica]